MNFKLHLFYKQCDKGKALALDKSKNALEEDVTDDAIFMSTDPIQSIRKIKLKANKKHDSLVLIEPKIDEIKNEIRTLLQRIHRYGVRNSFNCPNYLFMI